MAGRKAVVNVSVKDVPEVLASMRSEMARLLRIHAAERWKTSEQTVVDMAVRQSLEEVANCFEAGIPSASEVG